MKRTSKKRSKFTPSAAAYHVGGMANVAASVSADLKSSWASCIALVHTLDFQELSFICRSAYVAAWRRAAA
eukprot:3064530-Amphidinium_carterae.1